MTDVPANDEADYEDEWETNSTDGNEPAKARSGLVTTTPVLVHPLGAADDKLTCNVRAFEAPTKGNSTQESERGNQTGPHEEYALNAQDASAKGPTPSRVGFPPEIVDRHARVRTRPSPALVPSTQIEDALVACKRLKEYRLREQRKLEKQLKLENAPRERRKQAWSYHRPLYEALGIANLSCEKQVELHKKQLKQQAREKKKALALERQNRWYSHRKTPGEFCYNAEHEAKAFERLKAACKARENKRTMQRERQIAHLKELLDQKARQIVERTSGRYVKGSFILKCRTTAVVVATDSNNNGKRSVMDIRHENEISTTAEQSPDPHECKETLRQ